MFRTIWSKSLRDYRVAILSWGLGLGFLIMAEIAVPTPGLRNAYVSVVSGLRFLTDGYGVQTPEGYAYTRVVGVVPLFLSIWPILAGTRLVRGEEERGTLDVILATPQSR